MDYQDKYFAQDKNAILRAAQGFVEPQLLSFWIQCALDAYNIQENPMGLVDDFIIKLRSVKEYNFEFLKEPYVILSAAYRLKKGDNQLEIIWDGRSHYEVYAEKWMEDFKGYIHHFCRQKEVYRAILKACVLNEPVNHKFLFYGLRRIILDYFKLSINRKKMLVLAS